MNLIPLENIELISPLQRDTIISKIGGQLEYTKLFGNAFHKNSSKNYEGFVDVRSFKLRRIVKFGTNSFIPVVHGEVIEKNDSNCVRLKIRLHSFVYVFLIIVSLFMLSLLVADPSISGIVYVLLPYLFCLIAFNYESNIVKDDLKLMLSE